MFEHVGGCFSRFVYIALPLISRREFFAVSAITRDVMSCTSNHALSISLVLAAAHFSLRVRLKLLVGESKICLFRTVGIHRRPTQMLVRSSTAVSREIRMSHSAQNSLHDTCGVRRVDH